MAAGLLYFEPCFAHPDVADGELCEFADAFGALYFMIITVTTVGYGDQVSPLFTVMNDTALPTMVSH